MVRQEEEIETERESGDEECEKITQEISGGSIETNLMLNLLLLMPPTIV